jgi:hypothetical protein
MAWQGGFRLVVPGDDLRFEYGFEYLEDDPGPEFPKDGQWHTSDDYLGERRWFYGKWYICRQRPYRLYH